MKIDEQFHIEAEDMCCTLVKVEKKTRIDKETQEEVEYTATDRWHFLNIEQCLNRYVDLCINPCKSATDVLQALKETRLAIKNLKK